MLVWGETDAQTRAKKQHIFYFDGESKNFCDTDSRALGTCFQGKESMNDGVVSSFGFS